MSTVRVLGIDPGSRATGWGVLECRAGRIEPIEWGVVRPGTDGGFDRRLLVIKEGILEVARRLRPTEAAVEDLFHARNVRSALKLGQVRGVVVVALAEIGLPVRAYAPALVKKAVSGTGTADKGQVGRMVKRLLSLEVAPSPADAADALAVAVCHAHAAGLGTAGVPAAGRLRLRHPARG